MPPDRKRYERLLLELEALERQLNRELTPEERKFLGLAGMSEKNKQMRRLEPVFDGTTYPKYWKCSDCQKEFRRPADILDKTAHFPPVATWLEFEQHSCQKESQQQPASIR